MPRLTRTTLALLSAVALASATLAGCASEAAPPADQQPATTEQSSPGKSTETPGTGGEPTGQFTLAGQTWELTLDANDPNAACDVIAGAMANVHAMRTPEGNGLGIIYLEAMPDHAIATYSDPSNARLAWISTEWSSRAPEWSLNGSTIRVSGLWKTDEGSKTEAEGVLEITC